MQGRDHQTHGFEREPADYSWFEQCELSPVAPTVLESRREDGEVLATLDIPEYINRGVVTEPETGVALYRLVQLFGTPNVPGLEAGADQPDREQTTWQYLFEVTHDPEDGDPETYLLSVYDYRTDVSMGISEFCRPDDPDRFAPEPNDEGLPSGEVPPEELLVKLVKLVLHVVDVPVEATYKDLAV